MTAHPIHEDHGAPSDAADHLVEARQRARQILSGESHLAAVDDWRGALLSARNALIFVWLAWVCLHSFGDPPFTALLLVALVFGLACLLGISAGRSTSAQFQYYAAELDREQAEIRDHFEEECDEVRALYAAKGFREPLLTQIVDTLAADDDRLLKVMMEEELGLMMHHINHPLVVGLWNFTGALIAGLALALPAVWVEPASMHVWMPIGGTVILAAIAGVTARATGRNVVELFTVSVVMALVTGGVAYFLSVWLSGFVHSA